MANLLLNNLLKVARVIVYLPVVFGIVSALILIVFSTIDMLGMMREVFIALKTLNFSASTHLMIVSEIVGAVDLYLIAIVIIIFSFGLFELFISEVGENQNKIKLPPILSISSLDELKDKLAKVIVMVLVVSFFQRALSVKYSGALEMMYFALSISALSVGVYLLHKDAKFKRMKNMKKDSKKA